MDTLAVTDESIERAERCMSNIIDNTGSIVPKLGMTVYCVTMLTTGISVCTTHVNRLLADGSYGVVHSTGEMFLDPTLAYINYTECATKLLFKYTAEYLKNECIKFIGSVDEFISEANSNVKDKDNSLSSILGSMDSVADKLSKLVPIFDPGQTVFVLLTPEVITKYSDRKLHKMYPIMRTHIRSITVTHDGELNYSIDSMYRSADNFMFATIEEALEVRTQHLQELISTLTAYIDLGNKCVLDEASKEKQLDEMTTTVMRK